MLEQTEQMTDSRPGVTTEEQATSDAKTVIAALKHQAAKHPTQAAVISEYGSLSYAQLHTRSNQLAHYLQTVGVESNRIVALLMDRSLDMTIALWGILKAGGAYLPLDPAYPADRLQYMLDDAQPVMTLTQHHLEPLLASANQRILSLDTSWTYIEQHEMCGAESAAASDGLAYIIYTSGSTGKPKGVMISHGALNAFTQAAVVQYDMTPQDRVLQFGSLSFDVVVEEMFPTWHCGGTLILRPDMLPPFREFHAYLERQQITVLNFPTPFWHEWVLAMEQGTAPAPPAGLRLVIAGSDKAAPERLASWHRIVKGRVRWINSYGPTETTVSATAYEPEQPELGPDRAVVSIGRPLNNTYIYILNDQLQPVPDGEIGVLYIGGESVARGYLNRPDLTQERFIADPFRPDSAARLYNSGDLVRTRQDGNLEFLGRQDDQIKIRGFRIELGEIESVLRQYPSVAEVVVQPYDYAPHDTRLVAYVMARPGQELTACQLREAARQTLPPYMCPVSYTMLDTFPYSPNGKINRRALPEPAPAAGHDNVVQELGDPLILQLTKLWEDVLHLPNLGVDDNFFDLGGNSLSAVRLFGRIENLFNRSLPLVTLLQAPTIRELADIMRDEGWSPPWTCLVPIQPHGTRPPFFCVHAVGGNVLSLRELALKLGPDQPFYALQSQGLDGVEDVPASVEEMAAYYLADIQSIQPQGPYLLGGQSSGGIIAFEMAQRLCAQGEAVALLAMIDTYPPQVDAFKRKLTTAQRLAFHWQQLSRHRLLYISEKFQEFRKAVTQRAEMRVLKVLQQLGYYRDRSVPAALRYRSVRSAIAHATDSYTPSPYPGQVTLFRATETLEAYVEDCYGIKRQWDEVALSGLICRDIHGHHNLEKSPMVDTLAEYLSEAIADAIKHAGTMP